MQIAYHPAFDAGHAIFRFLRLRIGLSLDIIEFDKLRILDFYLLFPHRAASIRLMQADTHLRSLAKQAEAGAGYSSLPSDPALFARMEPCQIAAAQTMATQGAIVEEALAQGMIEFATLDLPEELRQRVIDANASDAWGIKIVSALKTYPLLGGGGLKDRTGLIEHRYDKV